MTRILVDDSLRSRLDNLDAGLVFCDETGRTLGYFVPAAESDADVYAWARSQFTDEEIESAWHESGGVSTDELLRELNET